MKRIFLLCWALLTVLSCKTDKKAHDLIPRDKLKDIMVDIYMVDGYYTMNGGNPANQRDTVNFYNDVLKQYGYTRANFDSTLKYYSRRIKEFDALYDDVITDLNKLQQETYLLQQYGSDSTRNLYKRKTRWNLPKDGTREMIPFNIAIKDTGLYTIIVQMKVFEDDQTKNPRLTAYFWYNDGTRNGHMEYFPSIEYEKSRRFVVLSTSKRLSNKKVKNIRGWILNQDNRDTKFKNHIEIKSIIVARN